MSPRALALVFWIALSTGAGFADTVMETTSASLAAFSSSDLDEAAALSRGRASFTLERRIRENRLVPLKPGLLVVVLYEAGNKSKVRVLESGHELWVFSGTLRFAARGSSLPAKPPSETVRVIWEDTPTHRIKIKYRGNTEIGRWEFQKKVSDSKPKPRTSSEALLLGHLKTIARIAVRKGFSTHVSGVHLLAAGHGRGLERIPAKFVKTVSQSLRLYEVELTGRTLWAAPMEVEVRLKGSKNLRWRQSCDISELPQHWRFSTLRTAPQKDPCWTRLP